MPEDDYKKLQETVQRNQQTLKRVRNLLRDLDRRNAGAVLEDTLENDHPSPNGSPPPAAPPAPRPD